MAVYVVVLGLRWGGEVEMKRGGKGRRRAHGEAETASPWRSATKSRPRRLPLAEKGRGGQDEERMESETASPWRSATGSKSVRKRYEGDSPLHLRAGTQNTRQTDILLPLLYITLPARRGYSPPSI